MATDNELTIVNTDDGGSPRPPDVDPSHHGSGQVDGAPDPPTIDKVADTINHEHTGNQVHERRRDNPFALERSRFTHRVALCAQRSASGAAGERPTPLFNSANPPAVA